MGAAVNANVVVADPVTGDVHYVAAGEVPDDDVAALLGEHLFTEPDSDIPPRSGKGSGAPAWAAYAGDNGVDVDPDASRDDIIAALEAASVPVE